MTDPREAPSAVPGSPGSRPEAGPKQGYDPHGVEERWYRYWEARGLFRADYDGTTLRDHLGLPRPENPRF